jgi:hypothetical protein
MGRRKTGDRRKKPLAMGLLKSRLWEAVRPGSEKVSEVGGEHSWGWCVWIKLPQRYSEVHKPVHVTLLGNRVFVDAAQSR